MKVKLSAEQTKSFRLKSEKEQCLGGCVHVSYPPLPAQAPLAEVRSYTPSLSAAPESFPTASPPGRQRAHGATHKREKNFFAYVHFKVFFLAVITSSTTVR